MQVKADHPGRAVASRGGKPDLTRPVVHVGRAEWGGCCEARALAASTRSQHAAASPPLPDRRVAPGSPGCRPSEASRTSHGGDKFGQGWRTGPTCRIEARADALLQTASPRPVRHSGWRASGASSKTDREVFPISIRSPSAPPRSPSTSRPHPRRRCCGQVLRPIERISPGRAHLRMGGRPFRGRCGEAARLRPAWYSPFQRGPRASWIFGARPPRPRSCARTSSRRAASSCRRSTGAAPRGG